MELFKNLSEAGAHHIARLTSWSDTPHLLSVVTYYSRIN